MKRKKIIIRIFSAIVLLLILVALVDFLFEPRFLMVNHVVNYFHVANTFLLLAIFTVMYPVNNETGDKE